MKKINILYTLWGMSYGGAERFVLNVVKHLNKDKYNIVVFSDSQKKGPLQKDFETSGAKVIYSNYHRFKHPLKFTNQLKDVLIEEKIDIMHANDDLNMLFPLFANKRRAKFVAHSHNTCFRFTNNRLISFFVSGIVAYYISKKADVRLACGYDAGNALFHRKDFRVIYNGLDVKRYKFSDKIRNELREQYNISDDCIVMLNIGRIDKEKNQAFLIEVFYEFQKQNSDSKLLIIGDGPEKTNIDFMIEKYNLSNKVIILSGRSDINRYYNMGDLFVMTSLYEGMPMVSIESQLNGLRCFFSDTISKESDHSGRTVFLSLKSGPKIWADKMRVAKIDRKDCNYDNVKKYDIENVVNDLDEIYENLWKEKINEKE